MAGYVILGKFRQDVPDMSRMDRNVSEQKAAIEKLGARLIGMWGLMGRFDFLMILDAPDEMTATGIAALTGRAMNASTETARAFSEEEMAALGRQMAR